MKKISQTYVINAPIEEVWKALTVPSYIEGWGAGPAKMSDKEGFEFSLWGGEIFGKNIKMVSPKLITQEWFGGKWDKPSTATFNLSFKNDKTTIKFEQVDVPDSEFKDVDEGWRDFYFIPLKDYLEKRQVNN